MPGNDNIPFDYLGAKSAGYSDQEIQGFLKDKYNFQFDITGAKGSGYSDKEIGDYITNYKAQPSQPSQPQQQQPEQQDISSYPGFGSRAFDIPGADQAKADQKRMADEGMATIHISFNSKETTKALNQMQRDEFQKSLSQTPTTQPNSETQPIPKPDIKLLDKDLNEGSEAFKDVTDPNSYHGRAVLKSVLQNTKDENLKKDLGSALHAVDFQNENPFVTAHVNHRIKSGELGYDPILRRPTLKVGAAQNFIEGVEKTYQAKQKADDLANKSKDEIIADEELERGKHDPNVPVTESSGWFSSLANEVGSNTAAVEKGILGGMASAVPGMQGAGANTLGGLFFAHDAGKLAAGETFTQRYHELRNQGVNQSDAYDQALDQAKSSGTIAAMQMAAMGYAGLKIGEIPLPGTVWNKGLKQIIKSHAENILPFLKRIVPEAGVQGTIAGVAKGLQNLNTGKPIMDDTGESAMGAATFVSLLAGLGSGVHALTPRGEQVALSGISRMNPDLVEKGINHSVLQGDLTEQQAQALRDKLSEQRALNKNIPVDAPLGNREKIQNLISKRNDLENQLDPEHPSFVDKAYHPDIKEQINGVKKVNADGTSEGKDGINEQIRKLSSGESPNFHEDEKLIKTPLDQAKELIAKRAVDGKIGNYDVSDPEKLLQHIAEQAHGGSMLDGKFISTRPLTEETFGPELTKIATEKYPEHIISEPKTEAPKESSIPINPNPKLRTLDYGDWKGKPESKEAQDQIKHEILNNEPIGKTGERIQDFAHRILPEMKELISNPEHNSTVVTHSSVIKALKVWEEMGRPDKLEGEKLKEFAEKYVNIKPEKEGHVNTFKGDNGTETHVIRHGETEDNKLSEFRQDDTQLTDKGIAQAEEAGRELYAKTRGNVPTIHTSDLPRAIHTSDIVDKELKGGKSQHTISTPEVTNIKLKDNAIPEQTTNEVGVRDETAVRSGVGDQDTQTSEPSGQGGRGSGQPPEKEAGGGEEEDGITSIRNAVTEEKIKAAGLKQPITEGERTFGSVWEEAKAKVDSGYDTNHLIQELEKNPNRPLSDLEDALLTYHNAVKEAELFDINKKINEAAEKGDVGESESYQSDKAKILDDLQHIYNIDKQAGAANARGLNARKLMVDRKYSLASMIAEKRATENFGEPLDKEQQAEVEKQFEDIKNKYEALQEHTKKLEAENAKLKADKALENVKKETKVKTKKEKSDYTKERKDIIDNIKKKWDESKGQLSSTILPYADRLVKIAPDVLKLVKSLAEEGIDNLSDVVKNIHGQLKDVIDGIKEKDVHDIIAGEYNKTKPTLSELSRKVQDLKTEAKLVNKIDEIQKGPKPKNSKQKLIQNKRLYDLRQQIKELKDTPASKTEAAKERIQKQIDEINKKIQTKDYSPPAKKTPPILDKEGFRLKAEYEKAKDVFDQDMKRNELKNSTPMKQLLRLFVRGERAFKLSNPVTLGKLASAAATRMATAPVEEGVGAFWSKILPKSITSKATGEAGFHAKALAKGYTQAMMQGIKEAGETARGVKTSLEANLGKKGQLPPEALDFFGQLHSALKAPVKRFAFERSYAKRMVNNIKNGVNVDDPMVQARISVEAYQDANRAIFMQDNWVSKGWTTAVRTLENSNNKGANFGAAVAQWLLPFVKVPTNIVAETAQHTFGFANAAGKIISVMAQEGLKNISQEDAEAIMRNLKKGSVGAAAMTLGFLNPKAFGGYYQDKENRDPKDVRSGETRVYGVDVPAWMQEAPIFQAMQFGSTIRRLADGYMGKKPMGMGDAALSASFGLLAHEPLWDEPARLIQLKDPNERKWVVGELAKSSIVPSLIDYSAKVSDPADKRHLWEKFLDPVNMRKPTNKDWPSSVKEHIESSIPILNQNLEIKKPKSKPGDRS